MRLAPLALAVGLAGAAPAADAQDAIEIIPLASVSYPGVLIPARVAGFSHLAAT